LLFLASIDRVQAGRNGNNLFGHGAIAHSHSQQPVLRIFPLDQPIRHFYFKLTN